MWVNVKSGSDLVEARELEPGELVVGRDGDCDLVLDDERVSRRHARLRLTANGTVDVEDTGSTNGTYVNGVRVSRPTTVRVGDEIRVGRHVLCVATAADAPGRQTVLGGPETVSSPAAPRHPAAPPPPLGAAAPPSAPATPPLPPGAGGWPPPQPTGRSRQALIITLVTLVVVVAAGVGTFLITQSGGSSTLSAQQLATKRGPSTLYIRTDIAGNTTESGTAWVYNSKEGLVVTNAHVVNGGTGYTIGQGPQRQTGQLVGVSVCDDLAVLKVPSLNGLRQFNLGSQSQVRQGEPTVALGYPGNAAQTPNLSLTTGVVSVPQTTFDNIGVDTPRYTDVIQTSAPINPGNSGGPLLDTHGRLIGVNTASITSTQSGQGIQNEGYAIGVDRAKEVLAQLAQGHSFGFTGMKFVFPTQTSDFTNLGLPVVQGGIIVVTAEANSPALNVGFGSQPLIITSINNQPLDGTLNSYCQIVGNLQSGQTATFHTMSGNGQQADVNVSFE